MFGGVENLLVVVGRVDEARKQEVLKICSGQSLKLVMLMEMGRMEAETEGRDEKVAKAIKTRQQPKPTNKKKGSQSPT